MTLVLPMRAASSAAARAPALLTCSALAMACGAAAAQTHARPLDPVVVVATRAPLPLSQVLADVTVLSREDLERHGAGSVADVLRGVAGFELSRSGGPAGTTSLFIRGGDTRSTAVLIDGVRVDSQSTGGAPWEAIPLAQIERIEILRGPAGAIYGSDATSGVVQIFTRKVDRGLMADIGVGAGSHGTANGDASLRGISGALDYALSLAAERSDGFNITRPGNPSYVPDRDGYESNSLNGRIGVKLSDSHRLDFSVLRHRLDAQYDGFASTADDHTLHELDTLGANWSAQWTKDWSSLLSIGQATDRYETRPSPYLTETRVRSFAWQNELKLGVHSLNATLERREDRLDNSDLSAAPTPGQGDRSQNAVGLGYAWRDGGRALQLHVRRDRDSEFGSHDSGAVAAGIDVATNWRVNASAGTAFRTPTLYQRFSEYGNALLRPEKSRNVELALQYRQGSDRAGVTVYRNAFKDLITFSDPGLCASSFGCYRNTARATLQGISLQAAHEFAAVRVSGSVDFQSPKDTDTGLLLPRRSRRHMALQVDTDVAGWAVGAQLLASGKRYDNEANTTVLGGYAVLNLDAQYRLNAEWRVLVRLDNAFDRDYETSRGYVTAPRTGFVGLRWTPVL